MRASRAISSACSLPVVDSNFLCKNIAIASGVPGEGMVDGEDVLIGVERNQGQFDSHNSENLLHLAKPGTGI